MWCYCKYLLIRIFYAIQIFILGSRTTDMRLFPINDLQTLHSHNQKWSDIQERCPQCWDKWKIVFPFYGIHIFWVMIDFANNFLQIRNLFCSIWKSKPKNEWTYSYIFIYIYIYMYVCMNEYIVNLTIIYLNI